MPFAIVWSPKDPSKTPQKSLIQKQTWKIEKQQPSHPSQPLPSGSEPLKRLGTTPSTKLQNKNQSTRLSHHNPARFRVNNGWRL